MPLPANRSLILPIAATWIPAAGQPVEQRLATRRHRVIVAIRRARERSRAPDERPRDDAAQGPDPRPPAHRRSRTTRTVARAARLLRARQSETRCRPTCRRSARPIARCSGPSSSITAVPEATTLPSIGRPIRRSNSCMRSGGNPLGNVGNGAIEHDAHQLPVASHRVLAGGTLGHPADAPRAALRAPARPGSATTRDRPSAASVGMFSRTCRAMLPSVLLPLSPYCVGIGQLADANAVEDDDDGAGNSLQCRGQRCRSAERDWCAVPWADRPWVPRSR